MFLNSLFWRADAPRTRGTRVVKRVRKQAKAKAAKRLFLKIASGIIFKR